MKKFTLLVFAAIMTMAASAQKAIMPPKSLHNNAATQTMAERQMRVNPLRHNSNILGKLEMKDQAKTSPRTATRAAGSQIITEAPAGKAVSYTRSGDSWMVYIFYILGMSYDSFMGDFVYADDNTVYIKNPFSQFPTDSYLKGTIDGDEIVVSLPQDIYEEDYYGYVYVYQADRYVFDAADQYYYKDTENSEIRYKIKGDSVVWDEVDNGDVILGIGDDSGWAGYGDYNTVYAPMTDTKVELPAGMQTEDWVMTYNGDGHFVDVGFDGNTVYIGNISTDLPDTYIKGTVDGDRITIDGGQYIGDFEAANSHVYMVTCDIDSLWDDLYMEYYVDYTLTDKIEFVYDAASKTISPVPGEDVSLIANCGKNVIYYLTAYDNPTFKYQAPFTGAVKPMPAEFTDFFPYDPFYGYGYCRFTLPKVDTEGRLLETDKMYYNMFIDDELFTFYPDEYIYLTEEMTDIPYDYSDSYDIYVTGADHTIYFYTTGFEKLGIRSTYTADNGETADSDITWYYLTPTGITAAPETGKNVKSVSYTDLSGRRISAPAKGLYIKTVTFDDGTVKSYKSMKR